MARKKRPDPESDEEIIYVSKSEMKRDMLALQALGEALVKLSDGELATIPIEDEALAEAIRTARRIKHREGLRRQLQYIGKLMRKIDTGDMARAYQQLLDGRKEQMKHFHRLEQWRDQLIEKGADAIAEVVEQFPDADRQHLRQLIVQAAKEKQNHQPPASARKLFRYLRELAEA